MTLSEITVALEQGDRGASVADIQHGVNQWRRLTPRQKLEQAARQR